MNDGTGQPGVGTLIEAALAQIGVTSTRVTAWIGKPCGCTERRDRLDALTFWARRVAAGKVERAREYLERILGEGT